MHEYIVDDGVAGLQGERRSGRRRRTTAASGSRPGRSSTTGAKGAGRTTGRAERRSSISICAADDTYTLTAWWPAAPQAKDWSKRVVFEVVAEGRVVASKAFDQTSGGDEWHEIATVALTRGARPMVRVRNEGSGAAIADAIHVRSARRSTTDRGRRR